MTLFNLFFSLLFFVIGAMAYATGQWVGFNQGRKSSGFKDEIAKIYDPEEEPVDLVDPYYNALHGIETKPGDDTKERIPTI